MLPCNGQIATIHTLYTSPHLLRRGWSFWERCERGWGLFAYNSRESPSFEAVAHLLRGDKHLGAVRQRFGLILHLLANHCKQIQHIPETAT